jgi:hypothetical protein
MFVMPGGADIPYTEKLNGQGNAIRHLSKPLYLCQRLSQPNEIGV